MPNQGSFELGGRAPDPVLQEALAHPDRIVRLRFTEHRSYLAGQVLSVETGEPIGELLPISKAWLQASARSEEVLRG